MKYYKKWSLKIGPRTGCILHIAAWSHKTIKNKLQNKGKLAQMKG